MPNVRLAWQITDSGMIWAAVSQAVRTPSKVDRELDVPGFVLPSPNFGSEKLTAYELGYRDEILPRLSFSASLYDNVYGDLRSDQGTPVTIVPDRAGERRERRYLRRRNLGQLWAHRLRRLNAGFNWLGKDFRNKPGFMDLGNGASGGADPATQVQLRSQMNLSGNWEFDTGLRSVGEVTQATPDHPAKISLVPAYVEADVRLGWHVFPRTEVDFSGINLLHDRHLEANDLRFRPPIYSAFLCDQPAAKFLR